MQDHPIDRAMPRSDTRPTSLLGAVAKRLRDILAEVAQQAHTLNFKLEWAGFALSAFGAYMLSFGQTSAWSWSAWAAWAVANCLGMGFGYRCKHYGYALQCLVFLPSSLHGLHLALSAVH